MAQKTPTLLPSSQSVPSHPVEQQKVGSLAQQVRNAFLNGFIFFGVLWSVSTIDRADPTLRHGFNGFAETISLRPVEVGHSIPAEFPVGGSGKTLAFFLDSCLGCNSKTLIYINRLSTALTPKGYALVLVTWNSREELTPLLQARHGKAPYLRCAFVSDSTSRILSDLRIGKLPMVVEFDHGKSVWACSPGENWFVSLQKRLNANGLGEATQGLTADTTQEAKDLAPLIESCSVTGIPGKGRQ
ncbi:MAG: hypothetical protein SFU56_04895 [Capsulimonadales bacterium]|nr:hypothetical protein [Capsulimonadales bacterium]